MFLVSSRPLPDGTYECADFEWGNEDYLGLNPHEYGETWWVYETCADYLAAID